MMKSKLQTLSQGEDRDVDTDRSSNEEANTHTYTIPYKQKSLKELTACFIKESFKQINK